MPLSSSIGKADTVVRRESVDVTSGTNNTTVTLKALSLASSPDLSLQDGRVYHITTVLADDGSGTMGLTRANSDGGTFTSSFTVTPILTFTNVNKPSDIVTIDCSVQSNNCSFSINGSGEWLLSSSSGFDPLSLGIPTVPSGVQVGGYTTVGRPRYGAIYPGTGGTRSGGYHSGINDEIEAAGNAGHLAKPPNDCAGGVGGIQPVLERSGKTRNATAQRAIAICATQQKGAAALRQLPPGAVRRRAPARASSASARSLRCCSSRRR